MLLRYGNGKWAFRRPISALNQRWIACSRIKFHCYLIIIWISLLKRWWSVFLFVFILCQLTASNIVKQILVFWFYVHEKKREWIRIIVKMKYKYVIYHHKRDGDDHLRTITKQILLFIRENCIHIFIERKKNIILVCMTPQKNREFHCNQSCPHHQQQFGRHKFVFVFYLTKHQNNINRIQFRFLLDKFYAYWPSGCVRTHRKSILSYRFTNT